MNTSPSHARGRGHEAEASSPSGSDDYRMRVLDRLDLADAAQWNELAAQAGRLQPFVRHEFLSALESAGCVGGESGWRPLHLTLTDAQDRLAAAAPLYLKHHSWGEYVFDWAWADAYERHGLAYYPKLLCAIPFTPVPGVRLLARDERARGALVRHLLSLARGSGLSSLHVLFAPPDEITKLQDAGMMVRQGVQFHWRNEGYADFAQFLAQLSQPKRKKIRAERRKVAQAGVTVRRVPGEAITREEWSLFLSCYRNTYRAHHSTPYLNEAFFLTLAARMPQSLLLVIAERDGRGIACSLLMRDEQRLYGRYWGAIESVDCLHFELAYYQSIEAAIELGIEWIEGGAQGEHKMARGFMPSPTASAHWLAEPAFARAVDDFLQREDRAIDGYLDELNERTPFKARDGQTP